MHEAGRCRTFNILVGFPHKITDSNHSRHFEADIFFHGFFMDFYKSKIQIIYTTLICPKTKKRYSSRQTQASKSLKYIIIILRVKFSFLTQPRERKWLTSPEFIPPRRPYWWPNFLMSPQFDVKHKWIQVKVKRVFYFSVWRLISRKNS